MIVNFSFVALNYIKSVKKLKFLKSQNMRVLFQIEKRKLLSLFQLQNLGPEYHLQKSNNNKITSNLLKF